MSKLVAGYEAIMPTYKGQLTEEDIVKLILRYIKGLGSDDGGHGAGTNGGGSSQNTHAAADAGSQDSRGAGGERRRSTATGSRPGTGSRSGTMSSTTHAQTLGAGGGDGHGGTSRWFAPQLPEGRVQAPSRASSPPTTNGSSILYLLSVTFFFAIGGLPSPSSFRLELMTPEGDLVQRRDLQQACSRSHGDACSCSST